MLSILTARMIEPGHKGHGAMLNMLLLVVCQGYVKSEQITGLVSIIR